LVWDKRVEEKQRDMNSDAELAWVKSNKNSVRIFRHLWKGMIKQSEHGQARIHPTQKPISLSDWCIKEYAPEAKIILDLFLGSGSTMIAAHQLKRKCYGMELEPKYCEVIIQRMRKLEPEIIIKRNGVTM
jgi:DNA modification methylase